MKQWLLDNIVTILGGFTSGGFGILYWVERRKRQAETRGLEEDAEGKGIANDMQKIEFYDKAFQSIQQRYTDLVQLHETEKISLQESIKSLKEVNESLQAELVQKREIIAKNVILIDSQKKEILRINKIIKQKDEIIKAQATEIKELKLKINA